MKRLILLLLLALASRGAMAEWVAVVNVDGTTSYANPATIRKQGSKVRMWDMNDYSNHQKLTGNSYQSMLLLTEYDCKEEKFRSLHLSVHRRNMGDGNLLYATDANDMWRPVLSRSVGEALLKFACNKSNGLDLSY